MSLNPLVMIVAVCNDHSLSPTDKAILTVTVVGTDNTTCKVRRSLSRIARDTGCKRDTVTDALKKPEVRRYFAKIDHQPRRVDLWLKEDPPCPIEGHRDADANSAKTSTCPIEGHADSVPSPAETSTCPIEGHHMPDRGAPSTSIYSSITTGKPVELVTRSPDYVVPAAHAADPKPDPWAEGQRLSHDDAVRNAVEGADAAETRQVVKEAELAMLDDPTLYGPVWLNATGRLESLTNPPGSTSGNSRGTGYEDYDPEPPSGNRDEAANEEPEDGELVGTVYGAGPRILRRSEPPERYVPPWHDC